MKSTRWQHNEVLIMGKPNQHVHGVVTQRVIAKDIVVLSKDTQSEFSHENRKLWLGFHTANYSGALCASEALKVGRKLMMVRGAVLPPETPVWTLCV